MIKVFMFLFTSKLGLLNNLKRVTPHFDPQRLVNRSAADHGRPRGDSPARSISYSSTLFKFYQPRKYKNEEISAEIAIKIKFVMIYLLL